VRLSNVRGLDDTRQAEVRRRLDDACRDFSSDEPVLALLCETAFETLTELNRPDGDCAFCLAPVADADDADASAVPFIKLMRCYHCFHENCFARWWRWRAAAAAEASAERGAHHEAASESEGKARPPTHLCPVCRVAIEDEDVRHVKLDGDGDGYGGDDGRRHRRLDVGTGAARAVRGGDGRAESQGGSDRGRRGRGVRVHAGRARVGFRDGLGLFRAERLGSRAATAAAAAGAGGGGREGKRRRSGRAWSTGVAEEGSGGVRGVGLGSFP
jgi:E3 ubiquitin-protein ligase RNF25